MFVFDLLVIAALLLANAFFVAAEFALVKVRTSQIDQLVESGHWAASITRKILTHLDGYISASQLGITLASLGLGRVIEGSVEPWIINGLHLLNLSEDHAATVGRVGTIGFVPLMAMTLVTFLHIAIGELVPKSLAIRYSRTIALWTSPPLMAFYYLFYPLIWLLNKASDLMIKTLGFSAVASHERIHSEEELRMIVSESEGGGELSSDERKLIENVLNLEDKIARRVMVPRPDIVYIGLNRPIAETLEWVRKSGHTRFPLCEDDLSTVIGMIHVKDLLRDNTFRDPRPDLRKLKRDVPFFPDTLRLDILLRAFQRDHVHIAMLVDEFGVVVGMVTLENVLEELVGPIQDEFDKETPLVESLGGGMYQVEATCPLDVFCEQFPIELPETPAESVGGLVLELLGRLARVGDEVSLGELQLRVIQTAANRIRRVLVIQKNATPDAAATDHHTPPPPDRASNHPSNDKPRSSDP